MGGLNVDAVLDILKQDGPLQPLLKGFEPRAEQKAMMRDVLHAFNQKNICLIEAGTGTGKSLAYLIPALLWAAEFKERVVISTHTIPLQEQLLGKDIPVITKGLRLELQATIVKGMQNYLCLRKFHEVEQDRLFLSPKEAAEWQKMEAWREQTQDGSRSSMPFPLSTAMWDKVAVEADLCNRNGCPFYKECYFFKARQRAQHAQILIVNHHILFSDLVSRMEGKQNKEEGLLPSYSRVILDEAHHIEDVATEYFASTISQFDILRTMGRLAAEKSDKSYGKLPQLKEKISAQHGNELNRSAAALQQRLTLELPGMRHELIQQAHETFGLFFSFKERMQPMEESSQTENKLRILPDHQQHEFWTSSLTSSVEKLRAELNRFAEALASLLIEVKYLKNPLLEEQCRSLFFEISSLSTRLVNYAEQLGQFMSKLSQNDTVRWIEAQSLKSLIATSLVDANLDISKFLVDNLFSKFATIVLCSATLSTNRRFDFYRKRLGLSQDQLPTRKIEEHIYDSPFDFKKQQLFLTPTDLPSPSDPSFLLAASKVILQAVLVSKGNAFVLFTSNAMLNSCFEALEKPLIDAGLIPLRQGDSDRKQLLYRFKGTDRSVLFATNSFWEGIDVSGDALRCVIIVKLPFKVPSEPLIQGRSEMIAKQGGNPFMEYLVPQAIVRFKQGCGRLIRTKTDRGCIICLDNRVRFKNYGKQFLESLPDCEKAFVKGSEIGGLMKSFYKRTHFLVNESKTL